MKPFRSFLLFLVCLPLLSRAAEPVRLRVLLNWTPQAQFAGIYQAQFDRLYENTGLNVEIRHAKLGEDVFDVLKSGRADLVISWPIPAMERKLNGLDLVNAGQMMQQSAMMLVARRNTGIRSIAEMKGHRIGLWPTRTQALPFRAFLRRNGVTDCRILPLPDNMNLFLYGGIDVSAILEFNELYQLHAAGLDMEELVIFPLNDSFPDLADDGWYAMRPFYKEHKTACRNFAEATLTGWRRAFTKTDRALRLVRKQCELEKVRYEPTAQRWMLDCMRRLIYPRTRKNHGILTREAFLDSCEILGITSSQISYEDFTDGETP